MQHHDNDVTSLYNHLIIVVNVTIIMIIILSSFVIVVVLFTIFISIIIIIIIIICMGARYTEVVLHSSPTDTTLRHFNSHAIPLFIEKLILNNNNKKHQKICIIGPLWWESTNEWWFPSQRAINVQSGSMSWHQDPWPHTCSSCHIDTRERLQCTSLPCGIIGGAEWGWWFYNLPTLRNTSDMSYTIECHYNAVQFITISHMALWWQQQNINETSNSQQTPHTSPSRVSYGVSIMRILKKIDHVTMALDCNSNILSRRALRNCGNMHMLKIDEVSWCQFCPHWWHQTLYRCLSTWLQYLQWISNGDTAIFHYAINIYQMCCEWWPSIMTALGLLLYI